MGTNRSFRIIKNSIILTNLSANNASAQIKVSGWKTYNHNYSDLYTVMYNEEFVNLNVHINTAVSISNTWKGWHNILTDDFIRPSGGITKTDNSGMLIIRISSNSENIVFKTITNTSYNNTIYADVIWRKK